MKKPVHSSIMSVTGKLAGGLMPALIIVFAFIFCPPAAAAPHLPKDEPIPAVATGPDLVACAESAAPFSASATTAQGIALIYQWDYDGDGRVDWTSDRAARTTYTYGRAGFFKAALLISDATGRRLASRTVRVVVRPGAGQALTVPSRNEYKADRADRLRALNLTEDEAIFLGVSLREKDTPLPDLNLLAPSTRDEAPAADGLVRRHILMFNGGQETRFWDDVTIAYHMFHDVFGVPEDDIHLLSDDGTNPSGENPGNMIDGPATAAAFQAVTEALAPVVDGDDLLFFWSTGHGYGYIGPVQRYDAYEGLKYYLSGSASVDPGDEQDYPEASFKLRGLLGGTIPNGPVGLNQWAVRDYPTTNTFFRICYVSHFTDLYFSIPNQTVSDNDVRIEKLVDYLAGDLNRDGVISDGEVMDFDNDGVPPYDPDTGAYDPDDWGPLDTYEDDLWHIESLVPEGFQWTYTMLDVGLDGHLDIDLDYDPDNPEANGTDTDNDGIIDFLDANDDKDLDDWISIDELLMGNDGNLKDDDIAAWLGALHPGVMLTVMECCYGGGFAWDLRGENRIFAAATEEETSSYGNSFIRNVTAALQQSAVDGSNGDPATADANHDGRVSMLEMFNFAAANDILRSIEYCQYDDNGDGVSHPDPIPAGGDGALGAVTFLDGTVDFPDLEVSGHALPASVTAGASFAVQTGVRNNGSVAAGASTLTLFIATEPNLGGAITEIASWPIADLAAGAEQTVNTAITFPAAVPSGTYYWGLMADATGAVTESDESNNLTAAGTVTVATAPQTALRLQYMSYRREANTEAVSVVFRIYNDGTSDIPLEAVNTDYWYSSEWPDPEMVNIDDARLLPAGRDIRRFTTRSLTRLAPIAGQNRLLTIGFAGGAGVLRPGDRVEVQLRVHYWNWKRYYQPNDYSFGTQDGYLDWRKMVVNCDGAPVWGEGPR